MKSSSKKQKTDKSKATSPSPMLSREINPEIILKAEQHDIEQTDVLDLERASDQLRPPQKISKKNKALIDAILELEKEDEIQATLIGNYIEQIKRLMHQLETVLHAERSSHAKILLCRHLLPDTDWVEILNDERIHAWQAEAAIRAKFFEKL